MLLVEHEVCFLLLQLVQSAEVPFSVLDPALTPQFVCKDGYVLLIVLLNILYYFKLSKAFSGCILYVVPSL